MDLNNNTILITGGGTGIGYYFAERFVKAGSKVIICGRRSDALEEAKKKVPQLITRVCDVAMPHEREELVRWTTKEFPDVNVLMNNAGIQRRAKFLNTELWEDTRNELAINLEAPIHLASLFIPHFLKAKNPAIINITSGLAFVPLTNVPIYCATKAAMHSYTLSLRHQLSGTPIQVIEIIPPAVNTDLGGKGLHTFGVPLAEFGDAASTKLEKGEIEVAYGFAEMTSKASREQLDQTFQKMNQPH
jgi:uncharacterized oxidoreductase